MTITADEFNDLMPHVITVKNKLPPDDYGEDDYDESSIRQYHCLVDDSTTTTRSVEGESVAVALTTYVNSVPIGQTSAVPIPKDAYVEFTPPPLGQPKTRPLHTVESHYWADGSLHNQVLRFT